MIEINKITDVRDHITGLCAVIFDLDDTLYSEKEYVHSGYKAVAAILPQVMDAEEKLWNAFEKRQPAIDTVLNEEGIYSEELKEKCLHIYRIHRPEISLYKGVQEMLQEIRKNGLKIGIITDGRPEGQRGKIAALGLESMVDAILITDELGGPEYRKPCEKAFYLIRDMIGINGYAKMCYVGDNIKKDFIAPGKLGMRSIWFKNADGLYSKEAI